MSPETRHAKAVSQAPAHSLLPHGNPGVQMGWKTGQPGPPSDLREFSCPGKLPRLPHTVCET